MEILGHVSSRAKAKKYFRSIDDNNSGKISQKEFSTWVKKTFPALTDKAAITFAFKVSTGLTDCEAARPYCARIAARRPAWVACSRWRGIDLQDI